MCGEKQKKGGTHYGLGLYGCRNGGARVSSHTIFSIFPNEIVSFFATILVKAINYSIVFELTCYKSKLEQKSERSLNLVDLQYLNF
jgi:hypothetical protein